MNIVIVGKGAIGMLWYSALAHLNNKIADTHAPKIKLSFWARQSPHPNVFLFTDIDNINHQVSFETAESSHLKNADLIIYTVKAYQIPDAIIDTLPSLNNHAAVMLCHNGMGTLAKIEHLLSNEQAILAMLTTHGCLKQSPDHAIHTGTGHTDIGLLKGTLSASRQVELVNILTKALPSLTWQENIVEKQWQKLAINCVINPLTALHNIKNGEITQAKFYDKIRHICQEISTVARAEQIQLDENTLIDNVQKVAKNTANNQSSMLCDFIGKRRTEIDYINGYIERLGQQHNIATPENSYLLSEVKKQSATF